MAKRKYLWAIFDKHGSIFTSTIKKTRRESVGEWLRQMRKSAEIEAAKRWRFWDRAGWRCDRITIMRHT